MRQIHSNADVGPASRLMHIAPLEEAVEPEMSVAGGVGSRMIRNVIHRHRPYQELLLHLRRQRYLIHQSRGRLLLPEAHHPDGLSHGLQLQPVHKRLGNNSRVATPVKTDAGLHLPNLDPLPQMVDPSTRWIRRWFHRNRKHPRYGDGPIQQSVMVLLAARLPTSRVVRPVLLEALQVLGVPHADLAGLPGLHRRHSLLRRQLLELGAVLHSMSFSTLPAPPFPGPLGWPRRVGCPDRLGWPDRVDRRLLNRRLVLSTALSEATAIVFAEATAAAFPGATAAATAALPGLLLLRCRFLSRDGRLTRNGGHHLVPLPHVPPKRRWLLL